MLIKTNIINYFENIVSFSNMIPLTFFSGDFIYLAVVFIILAIIAALVGARGVAGLSMTVAKWFIIIFIILAIISIIL